MRIIVRAVTVFALTTPCLAAGRPISLAREGGAWRLAQHAPLDTLFLISGRTTGGEPAYRVHRLSGPTAVTLDWATPHAPASIVALTINDARIRMRAVDGCAAGLAVDLGLFEGVTQAVAAAEISATGIALAAVDAGREAARLEAESWKAVQDYNLYNPHRQDALEKLREQDPYAYQRIKEQDAQQELLNTGLALTREAAGAAYEQERQWSKEAEVLAPVVTSLAKSEQALQALARDSSALERAGREFGAQAAAQVQPVAADVSAVRRECSTPARTTDIISLAPVRGARASGAIVVDLRFDEGTKARAVGVPASPDSDRWLATVFWPPAARGAEVHVLGPGGRRHAAGRIHANRESVEAVLRTVRKHRKDAERKLKEASWLGKGGASANSGVVIY